MVLENEEKGERARESEKNKNKQKTAQTTHTYRLFDSLKIIVELHVREPGNSTGIKLLSTHR